MDTPKIARGGEQVSACNGAKILIVDDEKWTREYLAELLREFGYDTEAIGDSAESLKKIESGRYDLVISDINMPHANGFEVLQLALQQSYRPEVLLVTAQGSAKAAIEAVREGAFDYLEKPIDPTRIKLSVGQALERGRLKAEIERLQAARS
jgi:DNA-binding NtrC family response regulator